MPIKYTGPVTEEDRMLAAAAAAASKAAVERTFAAGRPITVFRDGKLIQIYPDRHEVVIG